SSDRAACFDSARRARRRAEWSCGTGKSAPPRHRACASGSPFFSEQILEHHLVEREVGHEALELRVFLFELPQVPHLADAHAGVFALPDVDGLLADAQTPCDVRHGRARLALAHGGGHLRFGEFRSLHGPASSIPAKTTRMSNF